MDGKPVLVGKRGVPWPGIRGDGAVPALWREGDAEGAAGIRSGTETQKYGRGGACNGQRDAKWQFVEVREMGE